MKKINEADDANVKAIADIDVANAKDQMAIANLRKQMTSSQNPDSLKPRIATLLKSVERRNQQRRWK